MAEPAPRFPATDRGVFVAFEGGEASGKSTQARLLAEQRGALLTREPGGTPIGEQIRSLLLDPATGELSARTEALLMAAARAEHVAKVIEPALRAGRDVVTDRFLDSSLAYQGYGRGLPLDEVRRLSLWATAGLAPDLVVLLDVPPEIGADRRAEAPDRLERAGDDFHSAVRKGFAELAAADPGHWLVLDGTLPVEDLAQRIGREVERRVGPARSRR